MLQQDLITGRITICCIDLLKFIETESYEVVGVVNRYPDLTNQYNGLKIHYCPFCASPLDAGRENKKNIAETIKGHPDANVL